MPFDGNGIYNPLPPPDFPAVPGTLIKATQYNNQILDIGQALTNCLTRDGQGAPTANISWNYNKITNLADGTNTADAVNYGQLLSASAGVGSIRGLLAYSDGGSVYTLISCTDSVLLNTQGRDPIRTGPITSPIGCWIFDPAQSSPQINRRDQAANFPTSSWIYFWLLGRRLAGGAIETGMVGSLSYTNCTMPVGWTHRHLIGAVFLRSNNNLWQTRQAGAKSSYAMNDVDTRLASGKNNTAWEALNCTTLCPPQWRLIELTCILSCVNNVTDGVAVYWRPTGTGLSTGQHALAGGNDANVARREVNTIQMVTGDNNSVDMRINSAQANQGYYVDGTGYWVPNGDMG